MADSKGNSVRIRLEYLFGKLNEEQSASSTYRALNELRAKFVPHPPRLSTFIQCGGMKHIVTQLQSSNKKIVDVSLSILGHCVMEPEPRVLFRKEGGLPIILKVLQTLGDSEPAIRERATRVLGSLAHDKRNASKLVVDLSAHHILGQFLNPIKSEELKEDSLCMIIRALHHLCDTKEHVAILGKNHIIPKLSALLVRTDKADVLKKLLATLAHIFSFIKRFQESAAHYWIGSEGGGKVVARLVELRSHEVHTIATKAPEVLHLLIQSGNYVRPLLAETAAFEALIPVVKAEKESGICGLTVYLNCLLLLCRESPRAFSSAGGSPLLMDLIRESDRDLTAQSGRRLRSQHSNLFSTLLAFKYDPSGLRELCQLGLVDVLVEKIVQHTESCRQTSAARLIKEHQDGEQSVKSTNPTGRIHNKRQYRTTSPSYQAVEMEYDQLFRQRASFSKGEERLNIFGWHPEMKSASSSGRVFSPLSSPSHSTWSDDDSSSAGSSSDISFPASPCASSDSSMGFLSPVHSPSSSPDRMSPLLPPPFPSSSDFEESDGGDTNDEDAGCYSPATFAADIEPAGCATPPRKKLKVEKDRLCCETDLKMLWLKLGQSNGKDFYENWPEFNSSSPVDTDCVGRQEGSEREEEDRGHQQIAIYLLLKLSWLDDTPTDLASRKTFHAVIDHLVDTPKPLFRACQILFRLASQPSLFVQLLESRFPLDIYLGLLNRRADGTDRHCCQLHSSLRRVGEQILDIMSTLAGQFGRGKMEKILSRRKESILDGAEAVALAAPLILRSRRLLRRYVSELGILDIIFDGLLLPGEDVGGSRIYAIASLSALAAFLKMEDLIHPGPIRPLLADIFHPAVGCKVSGIKEDVFFYVEDDETIVGGVKFKLQETNSYFAGMFRGGFQESRADKVQISGVQGPLFKVILHIAYGCGCQCASIRNLETIIKADGKAAISLLESLDQFLMMEKLESVSSFIAHGQDWGTRPEAFVSLWTSLWSDKGSESMDDFSFNSKLRNHLRILPFVSFSSGMDLAARVRVVDALLLERNAAAANEVISGWKLMFLARLDQL